ncbi:MAG: HPr family phosphocarrier protein [Lachnospiraceae bacterium]|jgi:phosphocarrier protein|nr:HPr family phosphocarrier protein [Lachnospiraceae bacterium]
MVKITFKVNDEMGLHARPAGMLVKEAAKYTSKVTIQKGEKTGDAKRIFNVMSLSIKANEEVALLVEGEKEEEDAAALEAFIKENI